MPSLPLNHTDARQRVRAVFVLAGECLGGALWWKDLLQLAEEVGFSPPRLVTSKLIGINNKELEDVLGLTLFTSLFGLIS